MLQLYILHASSRLARHAIQRIQRIQLYSYTRYTAYSTIQPPSVKQLPSYQDSQENLSCAFGVAPTTAGERRLAVLLEAAKGDSGLKR